MHGSRGSGTRDAPVFDVEYRRLFPQQHLPGVRWIPPLQDGVHRSAYGLLNKVRLAQRAAAQRMLADVSERVARNVDVQIPQAEAQVDEPVAESGEAEEMPAFKAESGGLREAGRRGSPPAALLLRSLAWQREKH